MNELEQKILLHFEKNEVKNDFKLIAEKYFFDIKTRENFGLVFDLIKKGEFDVNEFPEFMVDWYKVDIEKADEICDELFDKVYGDVYEELQELYKQQQDKKIDIAEEVINEESKVYADLPTIYQTFVTSSFFQNILAAEKRVVEEAGGDEVKFKDLFYQAINGGDKIRFCGILRQIFNSGVHNFFNLDQRYSSFMQNFLNNQSDKKDLEEFKTNPAQRKFIILFLRLILEKKMGVAAQDSAMIGTGLAALAAKNNESEYAEMAYGDEEQNKFVWSD